MSSRVRFVVTLAGALWLVSADRLASATEGVLTRDAYTSSVFSTTNNGAATTCRVSSSERCWLRFFLPPVLPAGTTGADVAKATIKVWANTVSTGGSFDVFRVVGEWNQGTITHANAPLLASSPVESNVSVTGRGYTIIDATQLVQGWIDGTSPNEGVALIRSPGSTLNVQFDSRENTTTSHEARLDITLDMSFGVPAGAILLSDGVCPTGFSAVTGYEGRFLVASTTPGVSGGSNGHGHSVDGLTIPPHTHSGNTSNSCSDVRWVDDNSGGSDHYVCGANHSHAIATGPASGGTVNGATSPVDSRPEFITIALCRKS
ncbi:MAG: DNRLRE domain-containing protein [Patescibacteria group bacterium]